jgi:RES domain-containing protein
VPSVILPETWNILINPLHPDTATKLRVTKAQHVPLDGRFTRRG